MMYTRVTHHHPMNSPPSVTKRVTLKKESALSTSCFTSERQKSCIGKFNSKCSHLSEVSVSVTKSTQLVNGQLTYGFVPLMA